MTPAGSDSASSSAPTTPGQPEAIEFRPSKMPGMRRWRFELTETHLALRNMAVVMPVPPFVMRFSPDIVLPLSQIASAEVDRDPIHSIRRFSAVKGRKVIPGLDPFCVCYLDHGRQFFAVKAGRDALAVDLEGLKLQRLTVTFPDPALMVDRIARAKGAPPPPT
jgi:hypothetical protein